MTKEQKDRLSIEAKKFRDNVKEILSDDEFNYFSDDFFAFIIDFCFYYQETSEGTKNQ